MRLLAQHGDTVTIHYQLAYENGQVYDSSVETGPVTFTIGDGVALPGIEQAVIGMELENKKVVTLSAREAFGPRYEDLIQTLPESSIPDHINRKIGQKVGITLENGQYVEAHIVAIQDGMVTLDANPVQAGKSLVLSVQLMRIN